MLVRSNTATLTAPMAPPPTLLGVFPSLNWLTSREWEFEMTGVSLDLSINLTNIISIVLALVTVVTAFNKLANRIDLNTATMNGKFELLETRVGSVEETLRDNKTTNERLAVIEVRQNTQAQMMASLSVDIHDLRTGKGWIVDPTRS